MQITIMATCGIGADPQRQVFILKARKLTGDLRKALPIKEIDLHQESHIYPNNISLSLTHIVLFLYAGVENSGTQD